MLSVEGDVGLHDALNCACVGGGCKAHISPSARRGTGAAAMGQEARGRFEVGFLLIVPSLAQSDRPRAETTPAETVLWKPSGLQGAGTHHGVRSRVGRLDMKRWTRTCRWRRPIGRRGGRSSRRATRRVARHRRRRGAARGRWPHLFPAPVQQHCALAQHQLVGLGRRPLRLRTCARKLRPSVRLSITAAASPTTCALVSTNPSGERMTPLPAESPWPPPAAAGTLIATTVSPMASTTPTTAREYASSSGEIESVDVCR